MTKSVMVVEFSSSIPNKTLDPTGATTRTTLSYLDPPVTGDRLITRNGAVFTFTSQGPDGTKEFLCTVPSCPDNSPAAIHARYDVFSIHAANHGIFVQPYFCFRLEANATTGFTIGDDTDLVKFDVPRKFSDREQHWAITIYTALSKSHVFPAGSTMKQAVIDNWGKGYDVLRVLSLSLFIHLLLNNLQFSYGIHPPSFPRNRSLLISTGILTS